jgi:hypothetical protein
MCTIFLQEVKRLNVNVAGHLHLRPSVRTDGATCMPVLYDFMALRVGTSPRFESLRLSHQNIFSKIYSFQRICR